MIATATLSILVILLIINAFIVRRDFKRLLKSQKDSNDKLNESRDLLSRHDRIIKRHLPHNNR